MNDKKSVAPVLLSQREDTGIMRGRDVREKLKTHLHPTAIEVIATVAEINHTNCKAIAELATMFEQMVNAMQGVLEVAENMKGRTDKLLSMQESLEGVRPDDALNS